MARKTLDKQDSLSCNQIKTLLNRTHSDIARLSRLVEDMVDVSRMNIGKFDLNLEYFDLQFFLYELCEKANNETKDFHKIKVTINAPILVKWDKIKIEQVMMTLISNAVTYGKAENQELTVFSGGGNAYFQIREKHGRIPLSILRKITKLLKTEIPVPRDSQFLCLYIGHKIIKFHKGTLRFESSSSNGSVCEIQIPLS
jgi:K+-sensing histidine kinase KdpD